MIAIEAILLTYLILVIIAILLHIIIWIYFSNEQKIINKRNLVWEERLKKYPNKIPIRYLIRTLAYPSFRSFIKFASTYQLIENSINLYIIYKYLPTKHMKIYISNRLSDIKMPTEYSVIFRKLMLHYLKSGDFYLIHNAMLALSNYGDIEDFIKGYKYLSSHNILLDSRILEEYLLFFRGNKNELLGLLLNDFSKLKNQYQVAIINTIAYEEIDDKYKTLVINQCFNNSSIDVQCAIIRLIIAKSKVYKYRYFLIRVLQNEEQWQTAAIAAKALHDAKSVQSVRDALTKAAQSNNYHIAKNAQKSLEEE